VLGHRGKKLMSRLGLCQRPVKFLLKNPDHLVQDWLRNLQAKYAFSGKLKKATGRPRVIKAANKYICVRSDPVHPDTLSTVLAAPLVDDFRNVFLNDAAFSALLRAVGKKLLPSPFAQKRLDGQFIGSLLLRARRPFQLRQQRLRKMDVLGFRCSWGDFFHCDSFCETLSHRPLDRLHPINARDEAAPA
jgi:hypothetical protein